MNIFKLLFFEVWSMWIVDYLNNLILFNINEIRMIEIKVKVVF